MTTTHKEFTTPHHYLLTPTESPTTLATITQKKIITTKKRLSLLPTSPSKICSTPPFVMKKPENSQKIFKKLLRLRGYTPIKSEKSETGNSL